MTTYYYAEIQNKNSFKRAKVLKATTLEAAKREASREQLFFGTVLEIGTYIDGNGFIQLPVAQKINSKWG